jgi:hypothetical protein
MGRAPTPPKTKNRVLGIHTRILHRSRGKVDETIKMQVPEGFKTVCAASGIGAWARHVFRKVIKPPKALAAAAEHHPARQDKRQTEDEAENDAYVLSLFGQVTLGERGLYPGVDKEQACGHDENSGGSKEASHQLLDSSNGSASGSLNLLQPESRRL